MKYINYNRKFLLNDDFFNNKELQELEKISNINQLYKNKTRLFENIAYSTLRLEGYNISYDNAMLYLKMKIIKN